MRKLRILLSVLLFLILLSSCGYSKPIEVTCNINEVKVKEVCVPKEENEEPITNVRLERVEYLNLIYNRNEEMNQRRLLRLSTVENPKDEYIFVEDELVFTVYLEDSNFEFVSLQAIVFNGQTIRANTDDSIVTTRDCGAYICFDFNFIVEQDVTIYEVTEVKFVKVGEQSSISAIIDDESITSIELDVYTNEIYPFVDEAVRLLNEKIASMTYYDPNTVLTVDEWNTLMSNYPNNSLSIDFLEDATYNSDNPGARLGDDNYFFSESVGVGTEQGVIYSPSGCSCGDIFLYGSFIQIRLFDPVFKDSTFHSIGNDIYIRVLGEDYLVITMGKRTRIVPLRYGSMEPGM